MLDRLLALVRRPFRREIEPAGPQYGALPYTVTDGQLVVLLITSRGRGKWIFPKGGLMADKTPWESARTRPMRRRASKEIDPPIGSISSPSPTSGLLRSRSRCSAQGLEPARGLEGDGPALSALGSAG